MVSTQTSDIELAFRKRIRSQALYDRIGTPLPTIIGIRFQAAGVWEWEITTELPASISEALLSVDHATKLSIGPGPLAAIEDHEKKACQIVDVAELFVSTSRNIREAALVHFQSLDERKKPWISAYLSDMLANHRQSLLSEVATEWQIAALRIYEATKDDLKVNIAGLRQSVEVDYQESYTTYLQRLLRPSFASIANFRPTVWDPAKEQERIREMLDTWCSDSESLTEFLDEYVEHCGYLPLAGDVTAGRAIERWLASHPTDDLIAELWAWADSKQNPVCYYHVCSALIESPDWITKLDSTRLIDALRSLISSDATDVDPLHVALRLRNHLQRHYQFHLESLAPGMDGRILAAYSYWLTDQVASHYGMDLNNVKNGLAVLEHQLELSMRRWSVARSRIEPSAIRNITLFSPYAWAGSLLLLLVRKWRDIGDIVDSAFFTFFITELGRALSTTIIPVKPNVDAAFMFETGIRLEDLNLTGDDFADEIPLGTTQRLLVANEKAFDDKSLNELFDGLRGDNVEFAVFCAFALRSRQFTVGINSVPTDTLLNDEWRLGVFEKLPSSALDALIIFLTEWNLHQEGSWVVKLLHLLATDAERVESEEARKYLFTAVLTGSLNTELASPIIRMLIGPHKEAFKSQLDLWTRQLQLVSDLSEPWLANRLRGMRGSIGSLLQ